MAPVGRRSTADADMVVARFDRARYPGPMDQRPRIVTATGLRCPLPALRLAGAVRRHGPGAYRLEADDPAADRDVPALCAERGWVLSAWGPGWFEVVAGPEAAA